MASRSHSGSRSRRGRGGRDDARWSGEAVELQTAYALAQVIPEPGRPWRRLLRLDGEDCSHVDLRDPTAIDFAYVRRLADLCDLLAPRGEPLDAVHLGGGGFTLPRYVLATRPRARNEVAEIDPGLVELARAELGLRSERGLRVRVLDGRELLERRDPASADVVVLDAFHGTAVPRHLTTAEFVASARRALRPGGAFAANVIDVPPLEVARAVAAAAAEVFEQVAVIATRKTIRGRQGGNVVVLAAAAGVLPLAELGRRALRGGVPELVISDAELTRWLGGARPFRDPAPPPAPGPQPTGATPAAGGSRVEPAAGRMGACDESPGSATPPS